MNTIQESIYSLHMAGNVARDKAQYNYEVGMRLFNRELGDAGEAYAYEFLKKAAEMGHVQAMYELGMCYRWGDGGVYAEPEKAMEWFRKAAEQGHEDSVNLVEKFDSPAGLNILMMSAMHGINGEGSNWFKVKHAVDFYYSEANNGNAECQYELARQKADPSHYGPFKYDIEEAVYWYTQAGNNGVIDAMFNLAYIYLKGAPDLSPDKKKAREWFEKAAQAGDEEAMQILQKQDLW
ncbi:MAG: sel1 repeat family protein [Anaerofustis stercorihominis]|nr:sel1 repeat family protein [Anaerofustis stercorihominis]